MKTLKQLMSEGIDQGKVDSFMGQFQAGFQEELEHADTVGGDLVMVAKIVLDHLSEDPEYYTKLKKLVNA